MSEQVKRRYLSLDQFRGIAGATKEALGEDPIVLLMPRVAEIKALDDANLAIDFAISLPSMDREQDSIALEGWDFTNYRKNPVLLWAHDHYSLPIGRGENVRIEAGAVMSRAVFTPKDLNPFGEMVYRLYAAKFLHAVSVGFQPKEWTYADDRKWGVNYKAQELLEYSGVPVPCHPDALAVARSKGIDVTPMKEWAERILDENKPGATLSKEARGRLEVLRASTAPSGRSLILELGDIKSAKAEEKTDPPAPAAEVKSEVIMRYKCARGHEHATDAEAVDCGETKTRLEGTLAELRGQVARIDAAKVAKTGRILSAANESRIRTAVTSLEEVLSQLEQAPEVEESGEVVEDALTDGAVIRIAAADTKTDPQADAGAIEITGELEDKSGAVLHMSEADLERALENAFSASLGSAVRTLSGRVD